MSAIEMIPEKTFDPSEDDAPEIPMRAGEPLSDPYAKVGDSETGSHGPYTLNAYGTALIKARYDGTRATATEIGKLLGDVPAYQVIAWASSMELTNKIQPSHGHASAKSGKPKTAGTGPRWRADRTCDWCSATYIPTGRKQRTCSKACATRLWNHEKKAAADVEGEKAKAEHAEAEGEKPAPDTEPMTEIPETPEASGWDGLVGAVAQLPDEPTSDDDEQEQEQEESGAETPAQPAAKPTTLERMRAAWKSPLAKETHGADDAPEPEQIERAPVSGPLRVLMDAPETPDYRALVDLMDLLPGDGVWTRQRRERWVRAYLAVLDVVVVTVEGMVS